MSWNPKYVALILFTTFISYLCAISMDETESKRRKKSFMFVALLRICEDFARSEDTSRKFECQIFPKVSVWEMRSTEKDSAVTHAA